MVTHAAMPPPAGPGPTCRRVPGPAGAGSIPLPGAALGTTASPAPLRPQGPGGTDVAAAPGPAGVPGPATAPGRVAAPLRVLAAAHAVGLAKVNGLPQHLWLAPRGGSASATRPPSAKVLRAGTCKPPSGNSTAATSSPLTQGSSGRAPSPRRSKAVASHAGGSFACPGATGSGAGASPSSARGGRPHTTKATCRSTVAPRWYVSSARCSYASAAGTRSQATWSASSPLIRRRPARLHPRPPPRQAYNPQPCRSPRPC